MTTWKRDIEAELERARQSQHPGRTRTAARRIAGIALQEWLKRDQKSGAPQNYLSALRQFLDAGSVPAEVRQAASRLEARLSPDFVSPSLDPIADAMIIVEFVQKTLGDAGGSDTAQKS